LIGAPPSLVGLVKLTSTLRCPMAFTDVMIGAAGAAGRAIT